MDRDELIAAMARLLEGLAVPVSLELPLGKAGLAWTELHRGLAGFGWANAAEYEAALRSILDAPRPRNRKG